MKEYLYTLAVVWGLVHFANALPDLAAQNLETVAIIIISITLYGLLVWVDMFQPRKVANFAYYRNANRMGSVANYFSATGRTWTTASNLKRWSKTNQQLKNHLHLDNFQYSRKVINRLSFLGLKQLFHGVPISVPLIGSGRSGQDALEGILVLGSAGGGKSQFLLNLFNQNMFHRAVIHDIKGEFISYFYREDKDIILNSFDSRGMVWDMFEEARLSPVAIELFFDTYIENFMDKDFWSSSATLQYKKAFADVLKMNISSHEKLSIYNETIADMIDDYRESESRAKNSLSLVMEMIQEHFLSQEENLKRGSQTFTINNFIKTDDIRLFLSNRDEYASKLNPYFTAFLAVQTVILASKEDTKSDITLMLLDEYLSFVNGLKEQTLKTLHTTLRSRGVMIVSAMQSLPAEEEKKSLVWSNNRYFIVYPIMDNNTQQAVINLLGNIAYVSQEQSDNSDKKGIGKSYSTQSSEAIQSELLTTIEHVNYGHITIVPTADKLYIGKNDLFKKDKIAEPFIS